jgi:hypothetical protein
VKQLKIFLIGSLFFMVTFPSILQLHAYTFYCATWSSEEAYFKVNPNIADAGAGTTQDQILAHITAAFAWNNEAASHFDFHYDGTTTITTAMDDGVNVLFATSENGNGLVAVKWCYQSGGNYSGFDIKYYDGDVSWNGPGDPDSTQVDIWAISAHMMGHGLGLGHSTTDSATMYTSFGLGDTDWRDLHSDDIDGAQARYNGQPEITVQIIPDDSRASFGPSGGSWTFDVRLENTTDSTRTTDIWFDARLPFSPGEVKSYYNVSLDMPAVAPAGIYVVRIKSGTYSPMVHLVKDEGHVGLQKTATSDMSGEGDPSGIFIDFSGKIF